MTDDLSRWIDTHSVFTPNKPAIRWQGIEITYAQLAARIGIAAATLTARAGIGSGDRVAYLGLNTPEMLVLFFACARIGAMLLPLNWRLAAPEQACIMQDAAPGALISDAVHGERAALLASSATECQLIDLHDLASDTAAAIPQSTGTPEHPVLLVYTSGTTGRPKGAILSQNAILHNALNSMHMHDLCSTDHILTVLPMFHVGGLNIHTTPALYAGATVTLHGSFEPGATLAAIEVDRPSLLVLVPATIAAVLSHPEWANTDLSCLRALTTGSSIVPRPLIDAVHARGVPVIQVYGLTESGPVAAYQRISDAFETAGSAGRGALHTRIRIIGDQDREQPVGTAGELWLQGPNLFSAYWRDPASTAAAFCDGWFRTGDIGIRDDAGDIFIKDRMKDVIISGGENIYPAEIERLLDELDGITESAVIGRDDDRWGEVPVAIIVPAPGSTLSKNAIGHTFRDRLARFKHPKDILFVDSLPRNVMGKVQKDVLRQRFRNVPTGA